MLGNYRADQWLVGAIAGPTQLGLYSVAVAWAESLWSIPDDARLRSAPGQSSGRAPQTPLQPVGARFRSAVIVTSVLAAIMVVAAAPFLCTTIFGSDFEGSVVMLRVLLIGVFGIIALKLFGNALTAQRRPLLASTAISVGFATTIVSCSCYPALRRARRSPRFGIGLHRRRVRDRHHLRARSPRPSRRPRAAWQ